MFIIKTEGAYRIKTSCIVVYIVILLGLFKCAISQSYYISDEDLQEKFDKAVRDRAKDEIARDKEEQAWRAARMAEERARAEEIERERRKKEEEIKRKEELWKKNEREVSQEYTNYWRLRREKEAAQAGSASQNILTLHDSNASFVKLSLKNGQTMKCYILKKDNNGVWVELVEAEGSKVYFSNDEIKEIL